MTTKRPQPVPTDKDKPEPSPPPRPAGSQTELRGGQLWTQDDFPNCRCYLVYLGGGGLCRIPPPLDARGCIAMSDETGKSVFSAEEMLAILEEHKFTLKGQYYDLWAAQGTPP